MNRIGLNSALGGRSAFGGDLDPTINPMLTQGIGMVNNQQAQAAAQAGSVNSILERVLKMAEGNKAQANQPGQLGMDLSNPSGFQTPQNEAPVAPTQAQLGGMGFGMSPTGQMAQRARDAFGAQQAEQQASTPPAPQQSAFGMNGNTPATPPAGQPPTQPYMGQPANTARDAFGSDPYQASLDVTKDAFGNPQAQTQDLLPADSPLRNTGNPVADQTANRMFNANAWNPNNPEDANALNSAAQSLEAAGIPAPIAGLIRDPQKLMSTLEQSGNGQMAYAIQNSLNPEAFNILNQQGWGSFVDRMKNGAFR